MKKNMKLMMVAIIVLAIEKLADFLTAVFSKKEIARYFITYFYCDLDVS